MTTIRMVRLMNRQLQEKVRLFPLSLSLTQTTEGLSTAAMTVGAEASAVQLRDFMELYDQYGSAGIFRVAAISEVLGGQREVQLEHGLCTLRDGMVPGQSFMKPVREAFQTLLDCQPELRWALGEVEVPEDMTIIFSTDYADALTALQAMLDMLPEGYAPAFDQSVTPWVLHIRKLSEEVTCEGRVNRNLDNVRIEQDSSKICTRVYPFGAEVEGVRINLTPINGLDHASSDLAGDVGIISRTWHSDRIFDTATLQEVAVRYLARHEQPEARVTVDVRDLSWTSYADFDHFAPGKLCRVTIPEAAYCFTARIVRLEQPDVYGDPGSMQLTLSNQRQHSRESEEIDELVRQVRAGKLLGGTVAEVVSDNRAEGTYQSPIVHYFTVEDWPDLLDVRASFTPDAGVRAAEVRIDDSYPPDSEWQDGSFSAMPYLKRDALGRVAPGTHNLTMHPYTPAGTGAISSRITMTIIQEK